MLTRVKTFDATGIAPGGKLYAGDLNSIQDALAAYTDFAQTISLSTLKIGDSTLGLSKFGTGEVQLSAILRVAGIVRALGGMFAGTFTTTQRDAIAVGSRPYGLVIINSTTNQPEWNAGTDPTPAWRAIGFDPAGQITLSGTTSFMNFNAQAASNYFMSIFRSGDTNARFRIREDGRHEWGPGGASALDTIFERSAAGILNLSTGTAIRIGGTDLLKSDAPGANVPIVTFNAGPLGNGATYTIVAGAAGNYIIEWGAGGFNTSGQGSSASITCNAVAGSSTFADVGNSGGPVANVAALGAGAVVTFTVALGGSATGIKDLWAKLTRIT